MLAQLVISLHGQEFESVRLRELGNELLLEGSVTSYELKSKIEAAARSAGLYVQNRLRIIPGSVLQYSPAVPGPLPPRPITG
jgi:hypothetical protein